MRIGPHPAGERWTAKDDALLLALLDSKTTRDTIVRKLKRSRPAIQKRISILRKRPGGRAPVRYFGSGRR
jgi:hypothetical protein